LAEFFSLSRVGYFNIVSDGEETTIKRRHRKLWPGDRDGKRYRDKKPSQSPDDAKGRLARDW
jgi:hypothetical protein